MPVVVPGPKMFRRIRILLLMYILAFVAVGSWLSRARVTDWDAPLWVDIYPINGDNSTQVQRYIDALGESDFEPVERFLKSQAGRYAVELALPADLKLAPQVHELPPALARNAGVWQSIVWSLKMRWWSQTVAWDLDRPSPDIQVFAIFFGDQSQVSLDRSAALEKGRVAVANLFADRRMRGSNQVVLTHELLHTLGATDKYQPGTNLPLLPIGYGEPEAKPLYPQRYAEIMGGRIAITADQAVIPSSLSHVNVGPLTAAEIGWLTSEKLPFQTPP
jgi:hypothetical protein